MKLLLICIFLIFSSSKAMAYKVFYYNAEGERVYQTIAQKDFSKYKKAPKRAFVRQPRKNWEITDQMRARKKTYYYKGKN